MIHNLKIQKAKQHLTFALVEKLFHQKNYVINQNIKTRKAILKQ